MCDYYVVYVTCRSRDEACRIGRTVVEKRLAACANLVPEITSIYRWEGAVQEEKECLMILKTTGSAIEGLKIEVLLQHSYEVPEFVVVPIESGSPDYLQWLTDSVG